MGRCIDCVHYPWLREADPTYLPVHRCHPQLPARRWTPEQLREQNNCPFYEPVAGAEPEEAEALLDAPAAEEEPEREHEAAAPAEVAEADAAAEPDPEPVDESEEASGPDATEEQEPVAGTGQRVYNLPNRGRGRGKS